MLLWCWKMLIWMLQKQKHFAGILNSLNIGGKKALFVIPEYNDNLYLSLRNVPSVSGTLLSDINTYDIVNANVLVLTESAAKIFSQQKKLRSIIFNY